MLDPNLTVESVKASEVQDRWNEILDRVSRHERRVIVERDGRPIAAVISFRDLEGLNRYDAQRKTDFAAIERIGEAFKDAPLDELEREVTKALNEVREENRKRQAETAS